MFRSRSCCSGLYPFRHRLEIACEKGSWSRKSNAHASYLPRARAELERTSGGRAHACAAMTASIAIRRTNRITHLVNLRDAAWRYRRMVFDASKPADSRDMPAREADSLARAVSGFCAVANPTAADRGAELQRKPDATGRGAACSARPRGSPSARRKAQRPWAIARPGIWKLPVDSIVPAWHRRAGCPRPIELDLTSNGLGECVVRRAVHLRNNRNDSGS